MWETIVCPKNVFDEWHMCICLFRNYSRCGVAILPLCPNEAIGFDFVMVQWRRSALEQPCQRLAWH
jgi:hypothetical protein